MFKHPLKSNTTISALTEECIQPNAVDLKVSSIYEQALHGRTACILNDRTIHTDFHELDCGYSPQEDAYLFELRPGHFYQFETQHHVEIGEGEVGWIVGRSSLIRNGIFVHSGIYDTGFRGNVGGVLFNAGMDPVCIEVGARIGQLVLAESESLGKYEGQYQDKGVVSGN